MSEPPVDRFEFWVRFCFAFVFFGILFGLGMLRHVDDLGVGVTIGCLLAGVSLASYYAARVGDAAWSKLTNLLSFFRWW